MSCPENSLKCPWLVKDGSCLLKMGESMMKGEPKKIFCLFSKQTKNDVIELVKQSRNEDKNIRIVEGKE